MRMRTKTLVAWAAMALLPPMCGFAQEDAQSFGPKPTGAAAAKAQHEKNLKAHEGDPDALVLPGLVANRKKRTVVVLAEATGLRGEETAEFLIVDRASSHGYESLLWSYAKPSDVHRALEFIGLRPGPPRSPALPRLGADGDRVKLSVLKDRGAAFPIEQLIVDKETGKTLPEDGFVFAGSMQLSPADGQGPARYAADLYDPRSVAPLFNDPAAVLDVPRQAEQGDVYGRHVVNPTNAFEHGRLLTVILSPGDPEGKFAAPHVGLSVGTSGSTGVVFRLAGTNGAALCEGSVITPVLEKLSSLKSDKGSAPCVDVSFSNAVPVAEAVRTCLMLAMLESLGVARVNPPGAGQLYYRAFVPDMAWQKPEERPTQPWELHLRSGDGDVAGELVWNEPVESEEGAVTGFKRKALAAANSEGVSAALDADARERRESGRPELPLVLLVFAAPGMTYGQVVDFLAPAMRTHGTVYVFVEDEG